MVCMKVFGAALLLLLLLCVLTDRSSALPQIIRDSTIAFPDDEDAISLKAKWSVRSWMQSIGNQPLVLPRPLAGFNDGSEYFLGLDQPRGTKGHACFDSAGQAGTCTLLKDCSSPTVISSASSILTNACPILNRFMGVCCAEDTTVVPLIESNIQTLGQSTPQTTAHQIGLFGGAPPQITGTPGVILSATEPSIKFETTDQFRPVAARPPPTHQSPILPVPEAPIRFENANQFQSVAAPVSHPPLPLQTIRPVPDAPVKFENADQFPPAPVPHRPSNPSRPIPPTPAHRPPNPSPPIPPAPVHRPPNPPPSILPAQQALRPTIPTNFETFRPLQPLAAHRPAPLPVEPEVADCGVHFRESVRIVGGHPAEKDEWPWMAAVLIGRKFCGGSLINNRYVLTAAHCLQGFGPSDVSVILGEYDLQRREGPDLAVSHVIVHENFVRKTFTHDIALVRLESRVTFSNRIYPICLPSGNEVLDGKWATVVGYGSTGKNRTSPILLEVSMPITTERECKDSFPDFPITDLQVCAGFKAGGKDACQGDSGGPLMHEKKNGLWDVVGVVSFGKGCGEPNRPGVYTRVDQYLDWIERNVRF